MATSITIKDESATGKLLNKILLDLEDEIITVEELIIKRVEHEVEKYNQQHVDHFNGLVQPGETEITLNGYRMKKPRLIDAEKQRYIALKGFQENKFFVLVDNQQVDSLKQEIHLDQDTDLSFIRLTPLVGG